MKFNIEKIVYGFVAGIMLIMLTIIGFFARETFATIKSLERDVVSIRIKLADFEAKRISREEIERIIRDYHDTHPCIMKNEK